MNEGKRVPNVVRLREVKRIRNVVRLREVEIERISNVEKAREGEREREDRQCHECKSGRGYKDGSAERWWKTGNDFTWKAESDTW